MTEKKSTSQMDDRQLNLMKSRMFWMCGGAACASLLVVVIFWFTNIFSDAVLAGLELKNGSDSFSFWQRPSVRLVYKVRIFNYTNVEEFEAGRDAKLRVQEVGPYIYRETLSRVNPVFHENNGTVTYQEKRSYQWEGGSPDDEYIITPNVPLLSAVALSREFNFVAQVGLTALLTTLRAKTFINVTAGGYLWGYDDRIFQMGKPLMALKQNIPIDKFGLLAVKNGVSRDRITIHTGRGGLENLGVIQRINGKENRGVWGDGECDKIRGTDGSVFPPQLIRDTNNILQIYSRDMCRILPLRFHSYAKTYGIKALRYKIPVDIFTASSTKNTCFCPKRKPSDGLFSKRICPPAGIFNSSACNFNTPTLTSFPHFYGGDKSLLDEVDGLNPQEELHDSFADIHPRLGVPMYGWSRFQVNLEVKKSLGVPFLGNLKDGAILPLMWIEAGIDHIPEPVMSILNQAYFTARIVEAGAQWGGLLVAIVSTIVLFYIMKKHRIERHLILQRNSSGQNKLLAA